MMQIKKKTLNTILPTILPTIAKKLAAQTSAPMYNQSSDIGHFPIWTLLQAHRNQKETRQREHHLATI